MDEYLSEQEQWELVKKWLRENVLWIAAGIAIAAAGIGAYRWWEARKEAAFLAAGAAYEELATAFAANKSDDIKRLADKLAAEHPGTGYAEQGQMMLASAQVGNGQVSQGLETLQKLLAATRDQELALLLRLRIARVQISLDKADDALATLAGAQPGAFAARFAEVRGDALYAKGDRAGALAAYKEAAAGDATVDAEFLALKINELSRS